MVQWSLTRKNKKIKEDEKQWTFSKKRFYKKKAVLAMKSSGWDVDLSWVDVNMVKKSTSVTIKEVPTSLECMSMIASMSDLYETRKKISIKFEVKIQQPGVSNSDEK